MVKSVLAVNHQGLRDWAIQRVSAVIMAVYFVGLFAYILFNPELSYLEWRTLFSHTWMTVVTLLVLLGLLAHAWVGMWTIFTDYVKCYVLRAVLHTIVFLMLVACFIWATMILWSV